MSGIDKSSVLYVFVLDLVDIFRRHSPRMPMLTLHYPFCEDEAYFTTEDGLEMNDLTNQQVTVDEICSRPINPSVQWAIQQDQQPASCLKSHFPMLTILINKAHNIAKGIEIWHACFIYVSTMCMYACLYSTVCVSQNILLPIFQMNEIKQQ